MALNLQRKKEIVQNLNVLAAQSSLVLVADYRGLTAQKLTLLRSKARTIGITLKITRNTLACKALSSTHYSCLEGSLVGPVILALSAGEPGPVAKLFRDFAKDNEKFVIQAFSLDGKLFTKEQIDLVANLPTRDEALSKLLSVMQAPLTKLVRTLQAPSLKFVRTLVAIREKKSNE